VQIGVGYPLPFADAAFDSVTMRDVLEHSSHDRRTLTEVRRILRPGGLLVLTVLTRNPPLRRLVSGDMARAGREHTSYRAMEIIELLTSTGFQPQFRDGPRPLHATNVFMTAVASGPTEP
jgi:ubiquinone/menaquinone biosynthesis C-methylase UbiE